MAAGAEALDEDPIGATGHLVARRSGYGCRQEWAARGRVFGRNVCREPIAIAVHGVDDAGFVVRQRAAQPGHAFRERGFRDVTFRP